MTSPREWIEIDVMEDPTEVEISPKHAVMEFVVAVSLRHAGIAAPVSTNIERIQIGWAKGDAKPKLVKVHSEAAELLLDSEEVLEDLKEAVAYERDRQRSMN